MKRIKGGLWMVCVALLCGACSKQGAPQTAASTPNVETAVSGTRESLIVSTAASTQDVIEVLAEKFEAKTGTEVKINAGASSGLANQIIGNAPADLFFSASQQWADEVGRHGKAAAKCRLLTNELVLVVPADNPGGVKEPKDLLSSAVKKVALAGEKVPAGAYADQALTKLQLRELLARDGKIVRGQDVRSALSYVERGEAEAGIVYSTDLSPARGIRVVYAFDPSLHDEIVYVLVLLEHGARRPAANEFYKFLQSPQANAIYAKFGFERLK